ncbi:helix-turn-helix domain-containing protein [Vibrio maerlii]|uniref:helix-turn-helix domain-containing protein n=1 Tax=Vibrio maerlii TaxID=2231648 RepID=UPI000E3C91E8|nr:AraC family transcriptional regulator [Vibrio maerlii]
MIAWKQSLPGYEWLVHQVWYLEVTEGEVIEPKPHLIPNPRAHLLFTPPKQTYSYNNGSEVLKGKGNHLLTANENLLLLEDEAPLKRIGITFRPEALSLLTSQYQPNRCGWYSWLDEMFSENFQAQLWKDINSEVLITTLQNHFTQLGIEPAPDRVFKNVQQAVSLMDQSPQELPEIDFIAKQCACSRRTLERNFKQVIGLSLKKYQQMLRLEQVILSLYAQQHDIDWAAFSHQFGFSDQSHLIRTLKQLLKKTPAGYLKHRDLTIDIYGDFEP